MIINQNIVYQFPHVGRKTENATAPTAPLYVVDDFILTHAI